MNTPTFRNAMITAAAFIGLAASGTASAISVSLDAYNASTSGLDLSVDITLDGGSAVFSFANTSTGSAAGSTLARIYFESGLLGIGLSNGSVIGGTGTVFDASYPGPASPPGGNTIGWAGELAAFGASSPPPQNGLNVGDSLIIAFDYSGTLAALIDAVTDTNGNARIAGHVLDCVNGNSCAVQTTVVPLPAALPLLLAALGGLGFLRRRAAT